MPAGEEHVPPQQLLVCKEEAPPEQQEQTPSLDPEQPEPPHIKEEEEELWTNQEAEQLQDVTTLQVTAVKSEEDEEEAPPSQLHQQQDQMEEEAARSSDPAADFQPIRDEQLLSSHSSEETEDSEDERRPAARSKLGSPWVSQSSAAAQPMMLRENRRHDAAHQLQVSLLKSHEHAHVRGGFRGSQPITNRNDKEKRTAYFTAEEQRIILEKYEEEKLNIHLKSNTAAAAKSRQNAWQRIADCINACNPSGVKRTWEQVKVKHKNIIALANRKRNLQRQTGRGGSGENSSPAEELGLTNEARPIKDGVEAGVASSPGSQSTHVTTYGEIMEVVVPGVPLTSDMSKAEVVDIGDETVSISSDRAVKEEPHPSPGEPRASTWTGRQSRASTCWGGRATQLKRSQKSAADPVRTLYKRSLEKDIKYKDLKMQKMELEIEYLKLKIGKLKEQEENHYK